MSFQSSFTFFAIFLLLNRFCQSQHLRTKQTDRDCCHRVVVMVGSLATTSYCGSTPAGDSVLLIDCPYLSKRISVSSGLRAWNR